MSQTPLVSLDMYLIVWNQDDPCLAWKLDLVLEGETAPKLRTNRLES